MMNKPSDEFTFNEAVRENVHVLIALAGASGSGKTKTALELATGLAGPDGRILVADTESRRALHYANAQGENDPSKYRFRHCDMFPPFRPERFEAVIDAAEAAAADVLVIDSFSHEWDGDGGLQDWAAEIQAGTPKPGIENPRNPKDGDGWKDWLKKPLDGPGAWKEPKAAHKHLVQGAMLQARCHIIVCLRAEEKIRIIERGGDLPDGSKATKTTVVQAGWSPICEKRFMYEMTLSFTLRPDQPGIPQFDLPHKLQDQHRPFFPEGQHITREAGRRLAEWAAGAKAAAEASKPLSADGYRQRVAVALSRAKSAADLSKWWKSPEEKDKREAAGLSPDDEKALATQVTAKVNELKESA